LREIDSLLRKALLERPIAGLESALDPVDGSRKVLDVPAFGAPSGLLVLALTRRSPRRLSRDKPEKTAPLAG
jgi:hypothetical protein